MPRRSGKPQVASMPPGVGCCARWNGITGAIKCVAFDPGLHKLASGGFDGTVTLWDTADGRLLRTLAAPLVLPPAST